MHELICPCCGTTVRILDRNWQRIEAEIARRFPDQGVTSFDISEIPPDVDLTDPNLSDHDLGLVVSACVR